MIKQNLHQEMHTLQTKKDETHATLVTSEHTLNELKRKFDEDGDETTQAAIATQTQTVAKLQTDMRLKEEKVVDAIAKHAQVSKSAQQTEEKLKESLTLNSEIQASIASTQIKITEKLTEAEIFELPIEPCPKPFKLVRESFVLTGKIDGLRKHGDLLVIIEHKRRQKKLFQTVKLYEKIQCMSYLRLIMNQHPDKVVRCLLSETFRGTESNHEILFDSVWMEAILEYLAMKSAELLSLAATADVKAIANWMHSLQGIS